MFKTYDHAELLPADIFGRARTHHWQFVELEMHHPWFYLELVRDYGDDIVGTMLMVPTIPILQQMLLEMDERSWFAQAHIVLPGYMRAEKKWAMEPLIEVSVVESGDGAMEGYVFRVESGALYSLRHSDELDHFKVTDVIFSAERDLRAGG